MRAFWAYYEMDTLPPQTSRNLGSGHLFPHTQSFIELEHSYLLAAQGLYTHAFSALRSALELGVLTVYFAVDDREHESVRPWITSTARTPPFRQALARIRRLPAVRVFDRRFRLIERMFAQHDSLSAFVHTRGFQYSSTSLHGSNVVTFSEGSLVMYTVLGVTKVVRDLMILMLLKWPIGMQPLSMTAKYGLFPPLGGYLEEGALERVRRLVDPSEFSLLKTLSDVNQVVLASVDEHEAMPDLTPDDWARQVREFESAKRSAAEAGRKGRG